MSKIRRTWSWIWAAVVWAYMHMRLVLWRRSIRRTPTTPLPREIAHLLPTDFGYVVRPVDRHNRQIDDYYNGTPRQRARAQQAMHELALDIDNRNGGGALWSLEYPAPKEIP